MQPLENFHLVHVVTKHEALKNILKSDKLQSLSKQVNPKSPFFTFDETKEEFYYDSNKGYKSNQYDKKVFFGLIFPDQNNKPIFTTDDVQEENVYLIFDPKMIEDYKDCSLKLVNGRKLSYPLYCSEWTYGKYRKNDCKYYKKSKSLVENLNNFRNNFIEERIKFFYRSFKSEYNTPENEIAVQFSKDTNGECIEGEIFLEKYLQAIYVKSSNKQYIELAKKYPKYKWIFA